MLFCILAIVLVYPM